MKKLILALFIFMFLFNINISNSQEPTFSSATDIAIYMRTNFTYGLDVDIPNYFEYFQIPSVLEFSKLGDCDDFSTYSYYHLKKLNIQTMRYVLALYIDGEGAGHAITVFLDTDNTYSIFSNQYIFKTHKLNPLDAIKDVYPNWLIISEWTPSKYGRVTQEEFSRDVHLRDVVNISYYIGFIRDKFISLK